MTALAPNIGKSNGDSHSPRGRSRSRSRSRTRAKDDRSPSPERSFGRRCLRARSASPVLRLGRDGADAEHDCEHSFDHKEIAHYKAVDAKSHSPVHVNDGDDADTHGLCSCAMHSCWCRSGTDSGTTANTTIKQMREHWWKQARGTNAVVKCGRNGCLKTIDSPTEAFRIPHKGGGWLGEAYCSWACAKHVASARWFLESTQIIGDFERLEELEKAATQELADDEKTGSTPPVMHAVAAAAAAAVAGAAAAGSSNLQKSSAAAATATMN
jgi:hypothetical protein